MTAGDHAVSTGRPSVAARPALAATVALAVVAGSLAGVLPLLLAALVAVPTIGWIGARPQRGLLVLVALVPFDGLLLIAPLPDWAAAWKEALLGLTVAAALARPHPEAGHRRLPRWLVPLGGLVGLALLTADWSAPLAAATGLKVAFFGMATALVAWRCPLTLRDRDRLVTVLAATGALVALVGLWQQVVGHQRLNELGYEYGTTIRFTGDLLRSWSTFNQPFPFAFHLMLVLLVCGSVALAAPRRWRNRLILAATPLYLAGMAVAVVRAAWIGAAAGLVYLAFRRHRGLQVALPAVAGLLVLALAAGAGGFFASGSLDERVDRWQQLPAAVTQAPLGAGVGSAGAAAAKAEGLAGGRASFDGAPGTRRVFQPDNSYVKITYELGVLGLALFVGALVGVHATARAAERRLRPDGLAAGVSAFVLAAAVASFGATFFEIFPLDYLFWLLAGVVAAGEAADRADAAAPAAVPSGTG